MWKYRALLPVLAAMFFIAAPSKAQTIADSLDQSGWTFTTGAAPWAGQVVTTHDGVDAARAGSPDADGAVCWMETTQSLASAGTVEFWWKVSGARPLVFLVDGNAVATITGSVDWVLFSWVVLAGEHTFRWEYGDGSAGLAGDAGLVDEVSFASGTFWTLSVASSGDVVGVAGAPVTVVPDDANARAGGQTPLTMIYADGVRVEITAASFGQGSVGFGGWFGCDSVDGVKCTVTLTSDRAVTLWYLPIPELHWVDKIGGTLPVDDVGGGIARGPDGNVWATGTLYNRGGRAGGVANAWLGRYSADGTRLWEATFPGQGADVAVTTDGSVYMTGTMSRKLFVRKFSPDGAVLWTQMRPGEGKGVAVSPDGGSVYVTGAAAGDVLLQKYSSAGDLTWTRTYNGSANRADEGRRVAVAADGGVFVVGAVRRTGKGQSAWLRKYSPAGAVLWTAVEDGSRAFDDWAGALTLSGGRLYVAGAKVLSGHSFHWMAAYSEAGSRIWSYERSCDPTGPWAFESVGVAVSPLGTLDYFGHEFLGDQRYPVLFRLNLDGIPVDQSSMELPLGDGAAAGIITGEDGCYIVGRGFGNGPSVRSDIFVGKYREVAPSAP